MFYPYMKKLKSITHLLNGRRSIVIDIKINRNIIKMIDKILLKFYPNSSFFEEYNDKNNEFKLDYNIKNYKEHTIQFFPDEESGFLIFKKEIIQIIILKNSRHYKKLEKEIFAVFEFVDSPKISKK